MCSPQQAFAGTVNGLKVEQRKGAVRARHFACAPPSFILRRANASGAAMSASSNSAQKTSI
jgi:hypothetical protein